MLNYIIIYGILMGGFLHFLNHDRLVCPGTRRHGILYGLGSFWVKGMIISYLVIISLKAGTLIVPPEGYAEWWEAYFVDHSVVFWCIVVVPLTVAIYLCKFVTFHAFKDPIGFRMYDEGTGAPTLMRTTMKTPFTWYVVFWGWILLSPWLPFYRCFIQVFLLGRNPGDVISAF